MSMHGPGICGVLSSKYEIWTSVKLAESLAARVLTIQVLSSKSKPPMPLVPRLRSQSRCVWNQWGAFSGVLSTALCRSRFHSKKVRFHEKFLTLLWQLLYLQNKWVWGTSEKTFVFLVPHFLNAVSCRFLRPTSSFSLHNDPSLLSDPKPTSTGPGPGESIASCLQWSL